MHKDMHVLYFYGIVTSSQVMPTMMKKISNTVHTIALVSGAMGAPFFSPWSFWCKLKGVFFGGVIF